MMEQSAIVQYIAATFSGVDVVVASRENGAPEIAWGDTFFIYDPDRNLPANRTFPFATIVTKDYEDDRESNLNRPSVFRLNIGVTKETFQSMFGSGGKDEVDRRYDFSALDQLLPHPVYGRMHWVCVLNPSESTFRDIRPLLAEAYEVSVRRNAKATSNVAKVPPGDASVDQF